MKASLLVVFLVLIVANANAGRGGSAFQQAVMGLYNSVSGAARSIGDVAQGDNDAVGGKIKLAWDDGHRPKAFKLIKQVSNTVWAWELTEEIVNETATKMLDIWKSFKDTIAGDLQQLSTDANDKILKLSETGMTEFHQSWNETLELFKTNEGE